MGGHSYSDESYRSYSKSIESESRETIFSRRAIHEDMSPRGLKIRESRDSEANPNSIPVIVALDVTGSMGFIPEDLIKNGLSHLVQNIIDAGIPDPAICFIAVGDHTCDVVPLQVGQFESGDQQLVHWLKNTYIKEQGGGYGIEESYGLAWLFAANHTATDHWEKRKQKGFLFTIGDEESHRNYDGGTLKNLMGYGQGESFTDKDLLNLARDKWDIFHIHVNDANVKVGRVQEYWNELLGDHFKIVQDHKTLAATMADLVVAGVDGSVKTGGDIEQSSEDKISDGDSSSPTML